jgi:hypothetical protein
VSCNEHVEVPRDGRAEAIRSLPTRRNRPPMQYSMSDHSKPFGKSRHHVQSMQNPESHFRRTKSMET